MPFIFRNSFCIYGYKYKNTTYDTHIVSIDPHSWTTYCRFTVLSPVCASHVLTLQFSHRPMYRISWKINTRWSLKDPEGCLTTTRLFSLSWWKYIQSNTIFNHFYRKQQMFVQIEQGGMSFLAAICVWIRMTRKHVKNNDWDVLRWPCDYFFRKISAKLWDSDWM